MGREINKIKTGSEQKKNEIGWKDKAREGPDYQIRSFGRTRGIHNTRNSREIESANEYFHFFFD